MNPLEAEYYYNGDGWFVLNLPYARYLRSESIEYLRTMYDLKRIQCPTGMELLLHFDMKKYEQYYQESSEWMDDVFLEIIDYLITA